MLEAPLSLTLLLLLLVLCCLARGWGRGGEPEYRSRINYSRRLQITLLVRCDTNVRTVEKRPRAGPAARGVQCVCICSTYTTNVGVWQLLASRRSWTLKQGLASLSWGGKHGAFWTNCVRWSPRCGARDQTDAGGGSRASDGNTTTVLCAHFDGRESSSSRLLVARRFEGRGLVIDKSRGCCFIKPSN